VTRQERYRQRRRRGRAIFRIEVDEDQTIEALLRSHWLTEVEASTRLLVEEALAAVVSDWVKMWLRK
jgi:hypothetical protein